MRRWPALLAAPLVLLGCGSEPEPPDPPPPSSSIPAWWVEVPAAGLPVHGTDPGPHLALRRSGLSVALASGEEPATDPADAVARARQGATVTLAAAGDVPADRVWSVAEAAFAAGVREVRLAGRAGDVGVYVPLYPPPARPSSDAGLELAITVGPAGTVVSGSGGRLAPGCERTASGRGTTVSAGASESDELARCLARVKGEFPDDESVYVSPDQGVAFARLLALVVAARGPEGERFPLARLPAPEVLPGLEEVLGELAEADGSAEEGGAERAVRGGVVAGAPQPEAGAEGFDASLVLRQIRTQQRALQRCYEDELASDPTLAGRVVASVSIEPSGRVSQTMVHENTTGADALAECVTDTLRRLRFASGPERGSATFRVPFELTPLG